MSQDSQIYELPGDIPRVELPGDFPPTPFSSDPLPTPFSTFSGRSSHPSLRPRPLNFSRPRPYPTNSNSFRSEIESGSEPTIDPQNLEPVASHASQEDKDEEEEEDDDAAAPPPTIRTYADLKEMNLPRDSLDGASIDEALPPPIRTMKGFDAGFSNANASRGDSIYEDFPAPPQFRKDSQALPTRESLDEAVPPSFHRGTHPLSRMDTQSSIASSFDETLPPPVSTSRHTLSHKDTDTSKTTKSSKDTKTSRGDSIVEASISIPPKSAARKQPQADSDGPRVCIYKPYLDYASSQRSSSIATSTTGEGETNPGAEGARDRRGSMADSEASSTGHSSVTDFAFDGRLGWNPRGNTIPDKEAQRQQRWSAPNPLRLVTSRSKGKERQDLKASAAQPQRQGSTASSEDTLSPATSATSTGSSSSKPPVPPPRMPRIIKRTSIDQMSERVNPWQGETMSDRGSISSNEWASSDVDTSGLSVEKIHKLKKKGINPALYVEMQNARKGKSKWISPLQGNSFIS